MSEILSLVTSNPLLILVLLLIFTSMGGGNGQSWLQQIIKLVFEKLFPPKPDSSGAMAAVEPPSNNLLTIAMLGIAAFVFMQQGGCKKTPEPDTLQPAVESQSFLFPAKEAFADEPSIVKYGADYPDRTAVSDVGSGLYESESAESADAETDSEVNVTVVGNEVTGSDAGYVADAANAGPVDTGETAAVGSGRAESGGAACSAGSCSTTVYRQQTVTPRRGLFWRWRTNR